jgi:hypothetical protein
MRTLLVMLKQMPFPSLSVLHSYSFQKQRDLRYKPPCVSSKEGPTWYFAETDDANGFLIESQVDGQPR